MLSSVNLEGAEKNGSRALQQNSLRKQTQEVSQEFKVPSAHSCLCFHSISRIVKNRQVKPVPDQTGDRCCTKHSLLYDGRQKGDVQR